MQRYILNKFTGQYKATIGVDFMTKDIRLAGDKTVSIQVRGAH